MDAKSYKWLLMCGVVLLAAPAMGAASEPPEPVDTRAAAQDAGIGPVGVIDIAKVFANAVEFKERQADLRAEVAKVESEVRAAKKGIIELRRRKIDLPSGSEQEKTIDRAIESVTTGMQTRIAKAKERLLEQEAQLYWDFYQKVEQLVAVYAREHSIRVVLRKQPPSDSTSRELIIKSVQRLIVFSEGCDITGAILTSLNRNYARTAAHSYPVAQ